MMIKLTSYLQKDTITIVVNKIIAFGRYMGKTWVDCGPESTYEVIEMPEEIEKKMEEANEAKC